MQNYGMSTENMKKRKMFVIAGVLAVILLFGVLIGVMTLGGGSRPGDEGGDVVEEGVRVAFNGTNTLSDSMGMSVLGVLIDNVDTVITMPSELETVGESENDDIVLNVSVDPKSFIEDVYFPYTVYSFLFEVSDDRYYSIKVAADGEKYCGVLVQRFLPSKGQPYLYITNLGGSQNWNNTVNGLTNWAKSVYPDGFIVTTTDTN